MSKIYHIPVNFNKGGYVLNGLVETRKAVEAGCGALLGLIISQILPINNIVLSIVCHLFFIVTLAIIGFIGVRGDPFSVFFMNYLRWRAVRKHPFIYNPNGEAFTVSPTEMLFDERDAGDMIADAMDAFRAKFEKEKPEYIEGKTFRFAEDPTVARLRSMEEQRRIMAAEEEPPSDQSQSGHDTADINVDTMMQGIVPQATGKEGDTDGQT